MYAVVVHERGRADLINTSGHTSRLTRRWVSYVGRRAAGSRGRRGSPYDPSFEMPDEGGISGPPARGSIRVRVKPVRVKPNRVRLAVFQASPSSSICSSGRGAAICAARGGPGPAAGPCHLTCSHLSASVSGPRDRLELVKPQMRLEMKKIRNSAISVLHTGRGMGAIPQGFRRRFGRGRSRPTSANPVSRSEPAISAPYNHRQRHPGSLSSTTTSDSCRSPKPPDSRVDPGVSRFSGRLGRAGFLAIPGSSPATGSEDSQVRASPAPRYLRGLPAFF
jgi:hypothetical protein